MGLIRHEQIVGMNQHYQNYSLDYFLDAQQRIGITNIELWCGSQHFWLDDQRKLREPGDSGIDLLWKKTKHCLSG